MQEFIITAGNAKLPVVIHHPCGEDLNTALIISHGFRGSMDGGGRAVALAQRASKLGLTVIRFAFSPLEKLSLQVSELSAIVDYCRSTICSTIVLLGRSMGGSSAVVVAAQDQNIAGLCLWATPSNLFETFQLSLGSDYQLLKAGKTLDINDEYGKLLITPDFIEDFKKHDLIACIKKIKSPVLILHGGQDVVVPVGQAMTMFNYANDPKQLVIIDGGDHQFSNHSSLATDKALDWLKNHFS
ncbi:hypothetical protein SDC9_37321 [bioreactor metagenome]|uniref:Peptidase S9 prolyl oligopeptidase catalytic domain-containing protein n=1 Tax=bioreactor metagenome TaxID=1076179 RepID=A0A644VIN9_9ZZZZ|nr:acetylxylan esterase [Negativicutes bacterium]